MLKKYREPAWNYPVVRFFDGTGKELIPRKDSQFKLAQISSRMSSALAKTKTTSSVDPKVTKPGQVALAQGCFWTGELVIGGVEGVVKTEAGWLDGREVTLVHYDQAVVSEEKIVTAAKKRSCADKVYSGAAMKGYRAARESDQKRQLQGTPFAKIEGLTAYQRTKLNAFARAQPEKAASYLTPSQLKSLVR